jgi:hypothetical protein
MSSRASPKEVGQCSYRVAKQLQQGLPRELIHTWLLNPSTSTTMLAGTIVRCDGGAVTPYNRQARVTPPPAAATGAQHAPIIRKRPIERDAQDGRLLGPPARTFPPSPP